jgi:hypothetical protein
MRRLIHPFKDNSLSIAESMLPELWALDIDVLGSKSRNPK